MGVIALRVPLLRYIDDSTVQYNVYIIYVLSSTYIDSIMLSGQYSVKVNLGLQIYTNTTNVAHHITVYYGHR